MITVGDVMNMRAFDSIWLATPCDGAAAREVTGVGTLDHEPFTGGYEVFTQGEFVFTTLGFAGVHPDLAEEALLALIECGVDISFPVVYRERNGLDVIAQAAGRCNREGQLPHPGKVVVFVPPDAIPAGSLRKAADACRSVLHNHTGDPLDRVLFEPYFRQYYASTDLDRSRIGDLLKPEPSRDDPLAVAFRSAADAFRLINDDQSPVVVHYRGADGQDTTVDMLLGKLAKDGPERWLMRALQRYTVNLPKALAERLHGQGDLQLAIPGLYVQANDLMYDPQTGLRTDDSPLPAGGLVF